MAKLGEYVTIRNGKLDANAAIENGKYPFFTCSVTPLRIDNFSYDCECVLVAGNGDLNVKYYNGKFDAYQRTYIIESNDKTLLTVPYLYFFLEKYIETLRKQSIGGIIKYIKLCNLTNAEIPLCGINKQNQITTVLSKLNSIIEIQKKQLLKLDELIKSRFIEMFGDLKVNPYNWKCKNLLEIADIDTMMVTDYEKYSNYPHIGIDSIEKNTGRLFGYRTIAEDGVISGKYLFTNKHIIYSKIRPNLNKVALPDFEGLCSADAYPILPKENVCLRIYLGYVMRSKFFLDYILPFSRRANMPKVNKKQLSGFVLPVPNINSQKQFETFVEQVDKSKFECSISLNFLKSFNFYKNF